MDAEGAELEILIGLSSQICKVIPEDFTRQLDNGQIKWRFLPRGSSMHPMQIGNVVLIVLGSEGLYLSK